MKKLKEKWGITSNFQLVIIFIVFGITGSVSAVISGPTIEYLFGNLNINGFLKNFNGLLSYESGKYALRIETTSDTITSTKITAANTGSYSGYTKGVEYNPRIINNEDIGFNETNLSEELMAYTRQKMGI